MKSAHVERLRLALSTIDAVLDECEGKDESVEFKELLETRDYLAESIDHLDNEDV